MTVHYTPGSIIKNHTFHIFNQTESEKGHLFDIRFTYDGGPQNSLMIFSGGSYVLKFDQDTIVMRYILPYVESLRDSYHVANFCCVNNCLTSLKLMCDRKLVSPGLTLRGDFSKEIDNILGGYSL